MNCWYLLLKHAFANEMKSKLTLQWFVNNHFQIVVGGYGRWTSSICDRRCSNVIALFNCCCKSYIYDCACWTYRRTFQFRLFRAHCSRRPSCVLVLSSLLVGQRDLMPSQNCNWCVYLKSFATYICHWLTFASCSNDELICLRFVLASLLRPRYGGLYTRVMLLQEFTRKTNERPHLWFTI